MSVPAQPSSRLPGLCFVAVIGLAAWVRFLYLDNRPLDHAEGSHWFFFIDAIRRGEPLNHHSGVTGTAGVTAWYLSALPLPVLGDSVFALRFMGALAGVAAAATLWLWRQVLGEVALLVATLLLALSPALVYGSRQVSQYPYLVLALLLCVTCAVRFVRTLRPGWLYAAAAGWAVALTVHALSLVLLAVLAVAAVCAHLSVRRDPDHAAAVARVRAALRPRRISAAILVAAAVVVGMTALATGLDGVADALTALPAQLDEFVLAGQRQPPWRSLTTLGPIELPAFVALVVAPALLRRRFLPLFVTAWAWLSAIALSALPDESPGVFTVALAPMYLLAGLCVRDAWTRWSGRLSHVGLGLGLIGVAVLSTYHTVTLTHERPIASDNPLNHAGPTADFERLLAELDELPAGAMVVLAGERHWPLPYYLRRHELVYAPLGAVVDPGDCPGCAAFIADPGQIAGGESEALIRTRYRVREGVVIELARRPRLR
ncbi:glycosyltransferase family 39 protein [Haliangium sp.]|uniref:glycosyltransferase family 39 protein n=1 Tax=Haliangium sp. TaxID=2663208 RepID=UPI003D0E7CB9